MTTELEELLAVRGYDPRISQTDLYDHLIKADRRGVIAQAGTGTGKSMGILAAAAHQARSTGNQSIVVTPTLTLMNQYRDGDTPWAAKAFTDLEFAEVRGMAHYHCDQTASVYETMGLDYTGGCDGVDGGCSNRGWAGHNDGCDPQCEIEHRKGWECGYRAARYAATYANVVVTNADMLIVNDRVLANLPTPQNFLSLEGSLYVDEAHTLEQKLRDYASRSLFFKTVERYKFAGLSGPRLAQWISSQDKSIDVKQARNFPTEHLIAIARSEMPAPVPKDGLKKQREVQEACVRILDFMNDPHDSAVLHVGQGSLKMDWINVAKSSGELLSQRSFGLVSATVPRTMGSVLGVPTAPFTDVGHPFSYSDQAWIGFSAYGGDYRSAQVPQNFELRVNEVMDLIKRSKGGALLLFSAFRDMEAAAERLAPQIREMGLTPLVQDREGGPAERQALADQFKSDGNAVLFGSESFATGFDVPGDALRLVVLWKLPYPPVDPVNNAIRESSFARYEDIMKVRAVQAIGRLIRRESDRGIVWVADARGRKLLDPNDPLTSHIPQFARL